MMNIEMTILAMMAAIAVLAAYAYLYNFFKRDCDRESRPEDLRTIQELRDALAKADLQFREASSILTVEGIVKFLTDEIHAEIYKVSENGVITYGRGNDMVSIDCRNMPQDMMIGKLWRPESEDIDWDAVEKAAEAVTHELKMVKMHVVREVSYDMTIVTADRTLSSLREHFEYYQDLMQYAVEVFNERYLEFSTLGCRKVLS